MSPRERYTPQQQFNYTTKIPDYHGSISNYPSKGTIYLAHRTRGASKVIRGARRTCPLSVVLMSAFTFFLLICCSLLFVLNFPSSDQEKPIADRQVIKKMPVTQIRNWDEKRVRRGIVLSCPIGRCRNNHGHWKPRNMSLGAETIIMQLKKFQSSSPVYFGYYEEEKALAVPWCSTMSQMVRKYVRVTCFKIPEKYPSGMYGYAKIYALKHAPVDEALWLDCDIFPVRSLDPLFMNEKYVEKGAMFWPDSRDHFNESRLNELPRSNVSEKTFPLDSWWVRQGFDSGILLINKQKCAEELEFLSKMASSKHYAKTRRISMGDKDMFHLTWILRGRDYAYIPYIAETGSIMEILKVYSLAGKKGFPSLTSTGKLYWEISSQVKYGMDGEIYALHQLHRARRSSIRIPLPRLNYDSTQNRKIRSSYVRPLVLIRRDIQKLSPIRDHSNRLTGDFLVEILHMIGKMDSMSLRQGDIPIQNGTLPDGLLLETTPKWLLDVVSDMDIAWNPPYKLIIRDLRNSRRGKRLSRTKKEAGARWASVRRIPGVLSSDRRKNKLPRHDVNS